MIRTLDDKLYNLKDFTLDQIRDIAKVLSVPNSSKLNTFQLRHAIASLIIRTNALQKAPEQLQLTPTDIATKKRHNTIIRMINVVFSEKFLPGFLLTNDSKSRNDIETGVGGDMGCFWSYLSDEMNNSAVQLDELDLDDDPIDPIDPYKLIFAESIYPELFAERVVESELGPSDFTPTTGNVLREGILGSYKG